MTEVDPSQDNPAPHVVSARELAGLWVQSQPVISAYITANVVDRHHAEDLVQEVAQVVAEKFSSFDRQRSFTSWAMGIARNRLLKYYRTHARDRIVLSETALSRMGEGLERIEDEAEDRREALRVCMARIQGRRREVLEMRYGESVAIPEIATRFDMSASAVSVMLHRIRTALHRCIAFQLADRSSK
jgi:RNA polymerase sigma-70 factor, ECF subfamily